MSHKYRIKQIGPSHSDYVAQKLYWFLWIIPFWDSIGGTRHGTTLDSVHDAIYRYKCNEIYDKERRKEIRGYPKYMKV